MDNCPWGSSDKSPCDNDTGILNLLDGDLFSDIDDQTLQVWLLFRRHRSMYFKRVFPRFRFLFLGLKQLNFGIFDLFSCSVF